MIERIMSQNQGQQDTIVIGEPKVHYVKASSVEETPVVIDPGLGGVVIEAGVVIDPVTGNPIPDPDPGGGGGTPDPQPTGGNIGPDGVIEIRKSAANPKAKPLYLNMSGGDPTSSNGPFAVTYGGDLVKGSIKKGVRNRPACYETAGHVQNYASGNESSMSMRAHWFADGKVFDLAKYKWSDKPTPKFLLTEKCFYSFEMSAVIEVGDYLVKNGHLSCAFKVHSRSDKPNDDWRSTVEACFPNRDKPDAYFNYNYKHKGYESVKGVKQFTKEGVVTPNKPLGIKITSELLPDMSGRIFRWYVDTDPINADGSYRNKYVLKAEYIAKGIPEYQNIPPIWGGQTDYLRMDGYKFFRLYAFSIREIDPKDFKANAHFVRMSEEEAGEIVEPPQEDFNQFEDPNEYNDDDKEKEATVAAGVQA